MIVIRVWVHDSGWVNAILDNRTVQSDDAAAAVFLERLRAMFEPSFGADQPAFEVAFAHWLEANGFSRTVSEEFAVTPDLPPDAVA